MIFAHPRVRAYLLEHGIVYSYRKDHPKTSNGVRKQIGDDWATDKRTGKKIADIYITPLEPVNSLNIGQVLTKYAKESGFYVHRREAGSPWTLHGRVDAAASKWARAINELNPDERTAGWIYQVEVREAGV